MRKVLIIGIGAGNPDYLTIQAINALNQVDVFFIPNKGMEKEALQRLRLSPRPGKAPQPGWRDRPPRRGSEQPANLRSVGRPRVNGPRWTRPL